jgi:hypothetical protein
MPEGAAGKSCEAAWVLSDRPQDDELLKNRFITIIFMRP